MPWISNIVREYFHEGLSWVAVDSATGAYMGVCLNEDYHSAFQVGPIPDCVCPALQELIRGVRGLDRQYRDTYLPDLQPHQCIHLDLLGVHPDFAGRGLASLLVGKTLEYARAQGFHRAVLTATNVRTVHISTTKFGFEVVEMLIDYREWRNAENELVLKAVADRFPNERMCMAHLPSL
eukprot:TRINITY_DN2321_c0_g1_i2.p2 TRINITY_DN2321_c0_g1~~TRINITY_DN2321_c0_g1_i2.p2  ORF type:complete len:179 (+),score=33.31 TRINITY_DN2321_c0_g1_i2:170-706(+)